ncbi:MAG TPA: hypothetical protein PKD09_16270 [Aggregatilinea sp.]|uniref:hypothetical protein n=1 Tax=Aggregatilinea sp. TaxID=2806333 RepID=UPI002C96BBE2|nr:hypothetical protein [Aggregatilinea sp.]HML23211.1 hypothetical protein [Aggregatilinea sp.]
MIDRLRQQLRLTAAAGVVMAAAACSVVDPSRLDRFPGQRPVATATVTPGPCAWQWATQALPDVAAQLDAALIAAGLDGIAVTATAFGENCVDMQSTAVRFAAMETDFDLSLPDVDPADREAAGDRVAAVLDVIVTQFPPDTTPGPMPGRLMLVLGADEDALRITVAQNDASAALDRGLRGAALLDALESP